MERTTPTTKEYIFAVLWVRNIHFPIIYPKEKI